jgi:RNA polymerase sigma-70 factor (ECF subfamily)
MSGNATIDLQDWLNQFHAGDTAARDHLFRRAFDQLRRLADQMFARTDRRHVAPTPDVLELTTLRLLQAVAQERPASPRAFVRLASAQIRRELMDLARHHAGPLADKATPPGLVADDASSVPDLALAGTVTLEPNRLAEWGEFHRRVEDLRPEEREVVDLLWYQALTPEEAADLLGESTSALKRAWVAIRLKLADCFPGA